MKCVVVNDASCLIDLRKGGLLAELRKLPYRLVVPFPVRESVGVWRRTVERLGKRCVQEGLEAALGRYRRSPDRSSGLDGEGETRLLELHRSRMFRTMPGQPPPRRTGRYDVDAPVLHAGKKWSNSWTGSGEGDGNDE